MGTRFVFVRNSLLIGLAAVLLLFLIAIAPAGSVSAHGGDFNSVNAGHVPSAVYITVANYFYRHDKSNLAAKLFELAVDNDDSAVAHHNLGIIYYDRKNFEAAEGEFKKAIGANPDYARAHNSLALLLFHRGRYSEASAHFRKVVQLNPGNAQAHFDLAVSLGKEARYGNGTIADLKEALAQFKEAERLQPGYQHASANIKVVESIIGEYQEFQASLKQ